MQLPCGKNQCEGERERMDGSRQCFKVSVWSDCIKSTRSPEECRVLVWRNGELALPRRQGLLVCHTGRTVSLSCEMLRCRKTLRGKEDLGCLWKAKIWGIFMSILIPFCCNTNKMTILNSDTSLTFRHICSRCKVYYLQVLYDWISQYTPSQDFFNDISKIFEGIWSHACQYFVLCYRQEVKLHIHQSYRTWCYNLVHSVNICNEVSVLVPFMAYEKDTTVLVLTWIMPICESYNVIRTF